MNSLAKFACVRLCPESVRAFHTTTVVHAGGRYRLSIGKEKHMNCFRVIADTPCWSRLDGRPAPLNGRQKERYIRQMGLNQRVQQLLYQVDNAKETVKQMQAEKEEAKQRIIHSKLRSKAKQWKDK